MNVHFFFFRVPTYPRLRFTLPQGFCPSNLVRSPGFLSVRCFIIFSSDFSSLLPTSLELPPCISFPAVKAYSELSRLWAFRTHFPQHPSYVPPPERQFSLCETLFLFPWRGQGDRSPASGGVEILSPAAIFVPALGFRVRARTFCGVGNLRRKFDCLRCFHSFFPHLLFSRLIDLYPFAFFFSALQILDELAQHLAVNPDVPWPIRTIHPLTTTTPRSSLPGKPALSPPSFPLFHSSDEDC